MLIYAIHTLFILWIIFTPFLNIDNNPTYLKMVDIHSIIIPFLFFHWYTNDTCLLTEIEKKITGKHDNETFIGKILKPIYNISKFEIKFITFCLWCISITKLYWYHGCLFNFLCCCT